jgi:hypothetical protein
MDSMKAKIVQYARLKVSFEQLEQERDALQLEREELQGKERALRAENEKIRRQRCCPPPYHGVARHHTTPRGAHQPSRGLRHHPHPITTRRGAWAMASEPPTTSLTGCPHHPRALRCRRRVQRLSGAAARRPQRPGWRR